MSHTSGSEEKCSVCNKPLGEIVLSCLCDIHAGPIHPECDTHREEYPFNTGYGMGTEEALNEAIRRIEERIEETRTGQWAEGYPSGLGYAVVVLNSLLAQRDTREIKVRSDICQTSGSEEEAFYKSELEKILDKEFPKGECEERGKALVLFAYAMVLIRQAMSESRRLERERIREITKELHKTGVGFNPHQDGYNLALGDVRDRLNK